MRIEAAIRRASKHARMAMIELDREVTSDVLEVYERAAEEIRQRIISAVGSEDTVPLPNMRALLAQIENVIDQLRQRRDELLANALEEAVKLGTRPFEMEGLLAVGAGAGPDPLPQSPLDSSMALVVHQDTLRFVREFQQADGLNLSDRLWAIDRGAKEDVTRHIEQAVVRGWSATQAATEYLMRGEQVPGDVSQRMMRGRSSGLQEAAAQLTNRGSGALAQAERVFRTEINRAHGEAYTHAGERVRGFAGWRYLLSPAHPAPDICDLLSRQNLHGLGPGVYPTRDLTPWPAHPNTLSFLQVVFEGEVTDADRAGKQTSLEALGQLPAAMRVSVLGKTKAGYFDQGLLTTGMIRATTSSVVQRIEGRASSAGD